MKTEKMKVLLYLKKSGIGKSGKAPIMGRITLEGVLRSSVVNFPATPTCGIHVRAGWTARAVRRWRLTEGWRICYFPFNLPISL